MWTFPERSADSQVSALPGINFTLGAMEYNCPLGTYNSYTSKSFYPSDKVSTEGVPTRTRRIDDLRLFYSLSHEPARYVGQQIDFWGIQRRKLRHLLGIVPYEGNSILIQTEFREPGKEMNIERILRNFDMPLVNEISPKLTH